MRTLLDAALRKYPSAPGDYQAMPEPEWRDFSASLVHIEPVRVELVLSRFLERRSEAIRSDASLEGFSLSAPEIDTLISGGHVPGRALGEQLQVRDMRAATDFMIARVQEGARLEPGQPLSDDLHLFIARSLGLKSLAFRGDQTEQYEGPRVSLGRGEIFRALDARVAHAALDAGLARICRIEHPLARAATWAAFATYQQFYLDGNKRTGRYVMNAVAMSHGYDAIIIPAVNKATYEDALVHSYRTGDLTEHIRFLLEQYSDSHTSA